MNLTVFECTHCGTTLFPARYLCPSCGGTQWTERIARHGKIVAATTVHHRIAAAQPGPLYLASVATDAGPIVIARTESGVQVGDAVSVVLDTLQRIVAHRESK
ncbi:Zn-ribbon domain-containing OB-fold protein [Paraburkholderia sp.]|uniref:Zn-ribbon domain-containing OB-fold protein n=1 Tax=Paraburkholderia sp. TaxID=1926495 RepID=UPI003D6E9B3A